MGRGDATERILYGPVSAPRRASPELAELEQLYAIAPLAFATMALRRHRDQIATEIERRVQTGQEESCEWLLEDEFVRELFRVETATGSFKITAEGGLIFCYCFANDRPREGKNGALKSADLLQIIRSIHRREGS